MSFDIFFQRFRGKDISAGDGRLVERSWLR
jgi:hypothetical protein